MAFGLISALAAAVLYGVATILQAIGVSRIAAADDTHLLARLWAGRLYAVGLLLDLGGFVATVVALRGLPLFLVESAVASSVAVTAVLSVIVLGLRLHRLEKVALAGVVVGLALLAVTAAEGPPRHVHPHMGWVLLAGSLAVAALLGVGILLRGRASCLVLSTASGLGYACVGLASRVLDSHRPWPHLLASPTLWALVVHGVLATVAYGFALDRGRVTTVAAITFAIETVLPSAIGLSLLGDEIRAHLAGVAVVGFVLTLAGCLGLAGRAEPEPDQTSAGSPPLDARTNPDQLA